MKLVGEPALELNGAQGAQEPSTALRLFGPFAVVRNGSAAALPASRKVRALIAYLVMAPRPIHRAKLCELLWDVPDDPRGALRWCLTKIRGLLDEPDHQRVKAENDWVSIDNSTVEVDALWVAAHVAAATSGGDFDLLKQLEAKFGGEFLEGFEADRIPLFEAWLIGERQRFQRFHADVLSRIISLLPRTEEALPYIRKRLDLLPYDAAAHGDLLATLAACGRIAEGEAHLEAATRLFRSEGLSSAALEKAWREHRQLARGMRLESPPLSIPPPVATETQSDHPTESTFHAEREMAGPPQLSIVVPPALARLPTRPGAERPHIAWIRAAGLLLILAAGAGAWYIAAGLRSTATVAQQSAALLTPADPAKRPSHLSIVVLPFANLSGDANQDYFADGITENLTASLSRLRGFFVIARNTAFTFKGKNIDAREIGKELGVSYVLDGSVQRDQSQVRVNVQLVDAENDGHLWTGRFDGRLADLFQMQDQIVASLAGQLNTVLIADEARRAQRVSNPDSMDLFFQGQAWFNRGLNRENLIQARSFYERALALDPDNLSALTAKLNVDLQFAGNYMVDDRAERLAAVEATAIKLLAQAPNNAGVHYLMCAVQIRINRGAEAIAECERALELNPNLANAHAQIGFACLVNGRPEETQRHIREAIEASPRDTNMYIWMGFIAAAKLYSGADEEAVAWLRRTLEFNRSYGIAHFYLSAALELLGRRDDAQAEVRAGLALDPQFTIGRFRAGAQSDNPTFLKERERIIQAMQKAGIPEG
jgi:TolB-like protein/DNA-binding SARP family transcriptional activator/Flp pilus assembly protein TadD